ncbi:MAG TPA: hypothetical protein DIT48_05985 [Actinobacteria bacterium]|nr:hypothetical protein [Actinomycetota bacterium]
MTVCPSCGTERPPGARFCPSCGTPLSALCASCGNELPEGARFCHSCGTPAGSSSSAPPPATPAQERRVVTILFVDLVGFTERSDRADPEDVRRTLVPFHSAVKADIERYGGTLDKFIGDAVMGVFGAPVAHEDDPARAVRSALKILRSIEELRRTDPDIAVRIAVNTGEAVVSFGTGPQVGEAVAGDVVNTTSRMQGLAPRDSVVIGETTLRAVRDVFDVELVTSSTVKGKAEPITVWRVVGERLRGAADLAPGAFVGRRHELDLLRTLYARSAEGSSLQVVTLVGEPGIGKSRLLREFRRTLDPRPRWVTGECVPYGEMVTFAPVADTLREVTGIDPADSAVEAGDLLSGFAAQIEHDRAEREWLLSRLKPVLGLESADRDSTIPPEETAQAWARVMGSVADSGPLVVELADLHWAEPALIEAVERLAGALAHRPVLLLCTARPDLLEHHPGWGRGRTNATVVELPRLTAGETAELLSHLLAQIMLPPTALDSLLERAGGNPLYAVEFARMLDEQVTERAEHLAMPSSVQAVIAARLDAIPADLRALVLDASVVGTAFWPAALAALGDRPEPEVRAGLQALVQRGIVEGSPVSSVEGQAEFGFSHALVREVAYGRIPRAERARLHCTAGTWLERASGDRADERAELLARHFAVAVDLAEAAGERDVAEFARRPAVRWLMTAGERAALLDAATAFGLFDRAATLAPHGGPERATALEMSARMGRRSGSLDGQEVLRRYEAVLALGRTLGDPRGIGRALTRLGSQASIMGDTNRAQDLLREAVRVLEPSGPSRELALACAYLAEEAMFRGHVEESMLLADRTLDLQLATSDDFVRVMALHIRGDARCSVGDLGGLEDLEEALRLAEAVGEAGDIVTSHNYLAEWIGATQGPAQAVVLYEAGLALAERRGVVSQGHWTKGSAVGPLFENGRLGPGCGVVRRTPRGGRGVAGRLAAVVRPHHPVPHLAAPGQAGRVSRPRGAGGAGPEAGGVARARSRPGGGGRTRRRGWFDGRCRRLPPGVRGGDRRRGRAVPGGPPGRGGAGGGRGRRGRDGAHRTHAGSEPRAGPSRPPQRCLGPRHRGRTPRRPGRGGRAVPGRRRGVAFVRQSARGSRSPPRPRPLRRR